MLGKQAKFLLLAVIAMLCVSGVNASCSVESLIFGGGEDELSPEVAATIGQCDHDEDAKLMIRQAYRRCIKAGLQSEEEVVAVDGARRLDEVHHARKLAESKMIQQQRRLDFCEESNVPNFESPSDAVLCCAIDYWRAWCNSYCCETLPCTTGCGCDCSQRMLEAEQQENRMLPEVGCRLARSIYEKRTQINAQCTDEFTAVIAELNAMGEFCLGLPGYQRVYVLADPE